MFGQISEKKTIYFS